MVSFKIAVILDNANELMESIALGREPTIMLRANGSNAYTIEFGCNPILSAGNAGIYLS